MSPRPGSRADRPGSSTSPDRGRTPAATISWTPWASSCRCGERPAPTSPTSPRTSPQMSRSGSRSWPSAAPIERRPHSSAGSWLPTSSASASRRPWWASSSPAPRPGQTGWSLCRPDRAATSDRSSRSRLSLPRTGSMPLAWPISRRRGCRALWLGSHLSISSRSSRGCEPIRRRARGRSTSSASPRVASWPCSWLRVTPWSRRSRRLRRMRTASRASTSGPCRHGRITEPICRSSG